MYKIPKTIYGILLSLMLISAGAYAAQESLLSDFDGKTASLDQYTGKGKWLVVMFWASDCLICNKEAPEYVSFHERYKDKNAEILGISLDGQTYRKDALKFIRQHAVTFPNLIGEPEAIAGLYHDLTGDIWYGTPTFLVFAPDGTLKATQAGAVPPSLIEEYIKKHPDL